MVKIGPDSSSHEINKDLLKFMERCDLYIANLSDFDKYCVWRYTIGSGAINNQLIFDKLSDNGPRWTYLFFLYWKNTFKDNKSSIPTSFSKWKVYFNDPRKLSTSSQDIQKKVSSDLIDKYIDHLEKIILKAPSVEGSGFYVYKVARYYPQLPKPNHQEFKPERVLQLPFNSTTISPNFNFAPFVALESDCCLFKIHMPKGSKCLYIPDIYHAYPFEKEVLLPFGCIFDIKKFSNIEFNYVEPGQVKIVNLQPLSNIMMGPVYDIDEYNPCTYGSCLIRSKPFGIYETKYVSPK